MILKDLLLAQNAAELAGVQTPLGHEAAAPYQRFNDAGFAGKDFSAIIEMIRNA